MKRQDGYMIIEMLIVCSILLVFAALAMPNAVAMKRLGMMGRAKRQASIVYQLEAASRSCHALNQSCGSVDAMLPADGSTATIAGYSFHMNNQGVSNTWSYDGTPVTDTTLPTVHVDQSGQVLCNNSTCQTSWN